MILHVSSSRNSATHLKFHKIRKITLNNVLLEICSESDVSVFEYYLLMLKTM